jgi:small-conductance mechanosensitive channel
VITNATALPTRRVDLTFGIAYSDDMGKAQAIIEDVVGAHEKVLDEPEPIIKVHTLGDSSVNFIVRPWTRTVDYWDVYWDLTRTIKERFDAEGINIPFPQRDLHLAGPIEVVLGKDRPKSRPRLESASVPDHGPSTREPGPAEQEADDEAGADEAGEGR